MVDGLELGGLEEAGEFGGEAGAIVYIRVRISML